MRKIERIEVDTKKQKIFQQVIVIQLVKRPNRTNPSIALQCSGKDYL